MNNNQQITDNLFIDMHAAPLRHYGQSLRIDRLTLTRATNQAVLKEEPGSRFSVRFPELILLLIPVHWYREACHDA